MINNSLRGVYDHSGSTVFVGKHHPSGFTVNQTLVRIKICLDKVFELNLATDSHFEMHKYSSLGSYF